MTFTTRSLSPQTSAATDSFYAMLCNVTPSFRVIRYTNSYATGAKRAMIFIITPFLRRFRRGEWYDLHNQVSITSGKSSCAHPQRARPAGDHANGDRDDARRDSQSGRPRH